MFGCEVIFLIFLICLNCRIGDPTKEKGGTPRFTGRDESTEVRTQNRIETQARGSKARPVHACKQSTLMTSSRKNPRQREKTSRVKPKLQMHPDPHGDTLQHDTITNHEWKDLLGHRTYPHQTNNTARRAASTERGPSSTELPARKHIGTASTHIVDRPAESRLSLSLMRAPDTQWPVEHVTHKRNR